MTLFPLSPCGSVSRFPTALPQVRMQQHLEREPVHLGLSPARLQRVLSRAPWIQLLQQCRLRLRLMMLMTKAKALRTRNPVKETHPSHPKRRLSTRRTWKRSKRTSSRLSIKPVYILSFQLDPLFLFVFEHPERRLEAFQFLAARLRDKGNKANDVAMEITALGIPHQEAKPEMIFAPLCMICNTGQVKPWNIYLWPMQAMVNNLRSHQCTLKKIGDTCSSQLSGCICGIPYWPLLSIISFIKQNSF